MSKVIILGSGAAPGVPSLAYGFKDCDGTNPKNIRSRSGTYMELSGVKLLIDTSPDLRLQLLQANIKEVDAVFYTHPHADHLHGIDDIREVNRCMRRAIEMFASKNNLSVIRSRFPYLIADDTTKIDVVYRAALHPNTFDYEKSFYFKDLKVTPIPLLGHSAECTGYIFNDGEVVHIADFLTIPESALKLIKRQPELMIFPMTVPEGACYHASYEDILSYAKRLNPKRLVLNHLGVEVDYATACASYPEPFITGYDGLTICW